MVYPCRIKANDALDALLRGHGSGDALSEAASDLKSVAARMTGSIAESTYRHFATLLEAVSRLAKWSEAERSAEREADRFLRSAVLLARETSRETSDDKQSVNLSRVASRIAEVSNVDEVPEVARLLLSTPLPIPIFAEIEKPIRRSKPDEGDNANNRSQVIVAFTSFQLDGRPFRDPQTVPPQVICDLNVNVTASQWPEKATTLELEAVSVEPAGTYEMPKFSFLRPAIGPPFQVSGTGRLLLQYPTAFYARPLEFAYRARFVPEVGNAQVSVQGHRHLRLQCFDPDRDPQTGYKEVDNRVLEIRNEVRRSAAFPDNDLNSFLLFLMTLGRIAGQSIQDNLFPKPLSEDQFQIEIKKLLRADARIGSQLEEHPHAGGGITDLSFRGIRLELKVESEKTVDEVLATGFIQQTVQYVAGSDRRLGVLAILDCSPKGEAPGSVANDILLQTVQPPSGRLPICVGIVIIRGCLAKPSSLSKKSTS